jgi:pimeloyl-ACP methyl ester carboxylesterase
VLRELGHDPVAVDLPCNDESAGWAEYTDAVVRAVGERGDVTVVGHSLGGFTAPLVSAELPVGLLVLVAGMIPSPGELLADWWTNSGYEASGYDDVFYADVPPALAAEARRRERNETSRALQEPWPLTAWPDTPTRYLLCRDDRMFPAAWARRHARARLGIEADEIDGGHYISLSRPRELAERLHAYAAAMD